MKIDIYIIYTCTYIIYVLGAKRAKEKEDKGEIKGDRANHLTALFSFSLKKN